MVVRLRGVTRTVVRLKDGCKPTESHKDSCR